MRIFSFLMLAIGVMQAPLYAQLLDITNQPASQTVWTATITTTNIITTVAGGGSGGGTDGLGDGGAATNASINNPCGVVVDVFGNMFIADCNNNRIRKVNTNGIITVFAGGGTGGGTDGLGDGGMATNAILNWPNTLIVDVSGNLLIADYNNNRIRKVSTNGIITTIVGGGTDGLGDGGAATNASLYNPVCMAADSVGNLFIADAHNNRIRKVSTNGIITTVAGGGTDGLGDGGAATNASLNYAGGVAVDASGNIFIADSFNSRIRKVDTNGIITTAAGGGAGGGTDGLGNGGAATNASLYYPNRVTVDPAGNLLIADSSNNRIRKVDASGIITTMAGGGTGGLGDGVAANEATLCIPLDMVFDSSGNLFIADDHDNRVRKVTFNFINAPLPTLTSATTANTGHQDVSYNQNIVSSPSRSLTSRAALTFILPPANLRGNIVAGGFQVQFSGTPDYPYILQWTTNLTSPWQTIMTNDPDQNGNWSWIITNISPYSTGFYRAAVQ